MADPKIKFKGKTGDDGQPLEYLQGIPARDLSQEEYDALEVEARAAVRISPLYNYDGYKAARDKASTAAEEANRPVVAAELKGEAAAQQQGQAPEAPAVVEPVAGATPAQP